MAYRDAGKDYFQTSDSIATSERKAKKSKNQYGKPIKFSSKLLALCADPDDSRAIYVAEAAGNIKRLIIETGEKIQVLHAPAPLTSIALSPDGNKLFAGCWDKQIYATDFSSGVDSQLVGHADFVKCLSTTTINGTPILLSGSADATIIVWDLMTGKQRYKLKGHSKAVQDLVIDPESIQAGSDHLILFSASSTPEIRRWRIFLDGGVEIDGPITVHNTGIWRMRFDSSGDLWTASADNTAQHLVRSRAWAVDTTISQQDYVKDIVIAEHYGLIATACRDEDVRIWDTNNTKAPICTYSGHFEEVMALLLVNERTIISASIDGTIRRWSLERADMTRYIEQVKLDAEGQAKPVKVDTTAEEDAELEALMMDDE